MNDYYSSSCNVMHKILSLEPVSDFFTQALPTSARDSTIDSNPF